jgi:hypothetical protein
VAITIDYSQGTYDGYVINVNKVDMTLVETVPTDVYELDLNALRVALGDLYDDADNVWAPISYENTAPKVVSAALTLARVVLIFAPYWVLFEDAAYNVICVGANTNIRTRVIKNQVGVDTSNSAGLLDPFPFETLATKNDVNPLKAAL